MPANRHATRWRGRPSKVNDQSAGNQRNIAHQSREHRQIAATQRLPGSSATALIP